jgi:dihydroorotase
VTINDSAPEEPQDHNVEMSEQFCVVFPDGSITDANGGFENMKQCKQAIAQLKEPGFNFQLHSRTANHSLFDGK